MRTEKGQSLLELVMVLPILISFWAAIVWFARAIIILIILMHTARYGIFWLAYHEAPAMSRAEEIRIVTDECLAFLHQQAPHLDTTPLQIHVNPGDQWHPLGPRNLVDVPGIIDLMTHLRSTLHDIHSLISLPPASIEITYNLPAPSILQAIPGFPQNLPLRGYSACYR